MILSAVRLPAAATRALTVPTRRFGGVGRWPYPIPQCATRDFDLTLDYIPETTRGKPRESDVGIGDKIKQGAGTARQKFDESRQANAARGEAWKEAHAVKEAEEAVRETERAERRRQLFDQAQSTCPLSVSLEQVSLPGGLALFDDEFLVTVGKDWGWSSQKLVLTTKRVIYSRGRALTSKDQQTVYLTDVRDVGFHKPLMGYGSLALETAGGKSIEGLPAAKNGAEIRNRLLALIHWARSQAELASAPSATASGENRPPEQSVTDKLRELADLHASGILNDDEFATKKAELLSRL
jgi:Short C-terminal domain